MRHSPPTHSTHPTTSRRALPPWRVRGAALLLAAALGALGALAVAGCRQRAADKPVAGQAPADSAAATSEAQRTREMEQKASEINKKANEIQNMQGSEQEKIDAVNRLEKERQDLAKQAEGSGTSSSPPPPQ
ncbi:MAG TPA: hypothetical protein VHR45_10545 [Thermoanaerobaculia bacterium]|nr:hypothetical protein [Thermoanaerobaculia bacterium]